MKKYLLLLAATLTLGIGACTSVPNAKTNYTAVSVAPVRTSVSNAQEKVVSAKAHATKSSAHVAAATLSANTAKERVTKIVALSEKDQPDIHSLALQVSTDLDSLTQELLAATTENTALQNDLTDSVTRLTTATSQLLTVQKDNEAMAQLLNTANRERNAAITQGQVDKANAHKFKFIIIGLAVAAAGAIVFGIFGAVAFTPPLLYLMIGGPAAVGTFLFFWLG